MSKFIVYVKTGKGTPKSGQQYAMGSNIYTAMGDHTGEIEPLVNHLPDAEVEALEAKLATVDVLQRTANDLALTITAHDTSIDYWKARAEKAEAERDELRAQLADRETAVRDLVRGKDDTRARFERETAALLFARFVSVDGDAAKDELSADEAVKCARRFADRFFAPAPAPVKADAPPQFKVGDRVAPLTAEELELCRLPSRLAGVGATFYEEKKGRAFIGFDGDSAWWVAKHYMRPAPPAPPEPWTPKRGDEVKIIGSAFTPTDASRAMIGTHGKVRETYVDFRGKVARVGEHWFNCSDLEFVRAEDAAS